MPAPAYSHFAALANANVANADNLLPITKKRADDFDLKLHIGEKDFGCFPINRIS